MHILVINAGSSSVKFTLYRSEKMRPAASGLVERIGVEGTVVHYRNERDQVMSQNVLVADIREAVGLISELLFDPEKGAIRSITEIFAVGHRVVHGGEAMMASSLIDDHIEELIRSCFDSAPLHNPPNLSGIDACKECFPGVPQVAVFDTAFHSTMPEHAYLYALPYALYEKNKIRRFGFHGTSHRYVSRKASEVIGRPLVDLRMVTCHLGNGCSITAVDRGKSVDTSMGFTPLEGVPMGTRSGDVDPAILFHLIRYHGFSVEQVETLLNRESGLYGLGGIGSSDMRDLEAAMAGGHHGAERAIRVFAYRIKKYIGAYAFAMGGLDAIVFTAGIGENSSLVRSHVCDGLDSLGIQIDPIRNGDAGHGIREISVPDAQVKVLVIPTDEEMEIARQAIQLVLCLKNFAPDIGILES